MSRKKSLDLNESVEKIIGKALKSNASSEKSPISSQLQKQIHPDILFRYNTINLLVARRGIGKTFTVMKELIKLSQLPENGGYTTFLYCTDKTNDETVNTLISLIGMRVRQVAYCDLLPVLKDLLDAKNAYSDVLDKGLMDELDEESKQDIFSTLDISEWRPYIPHTVILLDDAINVLNDNKYKPVKDILFQNRQHRLTIFICVQDIFGLPVQIRRNCDTIFIFAGMTDKMAFGMMMAQLGVGRMVSWEQYVELPYRSALVIDNTPKGTLIRVSS